MDGDFSMFFSVRLLLVFPGLRMKLLLLAAAQSGNDVTAEPQRRLQAAARAAL